MSHRKTVMPDTAAKITATILAVIAAGLLVAERIATQPERPDVALVEAYYDAPPYTSPDETCPASIVIGQLATCEYFARYQVGDAKIALENNTTLAEAGDHLRFDIGRVVVDGNLVLTARDVKVTTDGVVSVVHFSWLNTMNVSVISGSAIVDQGGQYLSTVTVGNAVTVDTLPPYDAINTTEFNLNAENVNAFYDWALGRE